MISRRKKCKKINSPSKTSKRSEDTELQEIIEKLINDKMEIIKSLLIIFTDSIFSNLYTMPVGIRIICKLLKINALKRVLYFIFHKKRNKKKKFIFLIRNRIQQKLK